MAKDALGHGSEKGGGGSLTDAQAANALGQGHPKSAQVQVHPSDLTRSIQESISRTSAGLDRVRALKSRLSSLAQREIREGM